MSQLKSCVADVMDRIRRRHDADPGEFWHACLFWTFWVSLALFPIGYGWREVTPPLCFIFLLLYYRHAWHRSVLRRLTVWPLFLCAGAMTLIGVVFSTDVWQSFLHGGMGVNKAYILPFIAMECCAPHGICAALSMPVCWPVSGRDWTACGRPGPASTSSWAMRPTPDA